MLIAVSCTVSICFSFFFLLSSAENKCGKRKIERVQKQWLHWAMFILRVNASEMKPIYEAWLITIWCIECISNMLNCCDNSNWSMSENQQMSNLIESRHSNEIEQKKKYIEKKETKQINKNLHHFIQIWCVYVYECGHKTTQLQDKWCARKREIAKKNERI